MDTCRQHDCREQLCAGKKNARITKLFAAASHEQTGLIQLGNGLKKLINARPLSHVDLLEKNEEVAIAPSNLDCGILCVVALCSSVPRNTLSTWESRNSSLQDDLKPRTATRIATPMPDNCVASPNPQTVHLGGILTATQMWGKAASRMATAGSQGEDQITSDRGEGTVHLS